MTNLSCLEDEFTECRLSTPRTARSGAISNDEDENSRLKQQLSKERERSDRLQLKVCPSFVRGLLIAKTCELNAYVHQIEDLLAEQKGLQEALNAALTMMSGSIATPRRTAGRMEEESHAPTTHDDELASIGLKMALENASVWNEHPLLHRCRDLPSASCIFLDALTCHDGTLSLPVCSDATAILHDRILCTRPKRQYLILSMSSLRWCNNGMPLYSRSPHCEETMTQMTWGQTSVGTSEGPGEGLDLIFNLCWV